MNPPTADGRFLADLRLRHNSGEHFRYVFFWGHRPAASGVSAACFSQWYDAPFTVDGRRYATAEHFMMAEKAALFGDEAMRRRILESRDPGAAKEFGRQVRGFEAGLWERHRFDRVVKGNLAKFAQNPALGEFLQATRQQVLVEASPVDRIWGIGLAATDDGVENPNCWRGLNLLGFALMRVREEMASGA